MLHYAPAHRTRGPRHGRPRRHDLRTRDEARPQRVTSPVPLATSSRRGLVYTERDGRRKRVVPSDARAVELYRDLVRQHSHIEFSGFADRQGTRGAVLPRPAANRLPRSPTGATTTATRSTASSSGFVTVVSSGRPTAAMTSTPISTASTSSPGNSHTIYIATASKPSPRRARFSGRTTTNSSPRPKRSSTRRRSTKPGLPDSRPSTSSSYSPTIDTTSSPRRSTQSRRRSCAVTRC